MPFNVKQIGDDVLMGQIKSVKVKLEKAGTKKPANLVKYLAELEAEAKARAEHYAKRDKKPMPKAEPAMEKAEPAMEKEEPKVEEKKA